MHQFLQKQNTNGEEKRRSNDERRKTEPRRGEGDRFYTTSLPTKNRIIFFWAVALNSVRYLIDFRTKFLKIPPDFLKFIVKSVDNYVSDHVRIGFAAFVSDSIETRVDRPGILTIARAWNVHCPSVMSLRKSSMIVAVAVMFCNSR